MTLTPEQFNKLVTKEDLNDALENVATKEDINKVLSAVDKVMKDNETIKEEQTANVGAHDRFEKRLTNLENPANAVI